MMHQGRYRAGQYATLFVQCRDGSGLPVAPDACPRLDVYGPGGKPLSGVPQPILDPDFAPGVFVARVFLDADFPEGQYGAVWGWLVSGAAGSAVDSFEVTPGGGVTGQVVAMFDYARPQADFLVQQRAGLSFAKGANPRL